MCVCEGVTGCGNTHGVDYKAVLVYVSNKHLMQRSICVCIFVKTLFSKLVYITHEVQDKIQKCW